MLEPFGVVLSTTFCVGALFLFSIMMFFRAKYGVKRNFIAADAPLIAAVILLSSFPVNVVDRQTSAVLVGQTVVYLLMAVITVSLTAIDTFRSEITPQTFVLFGFRLFELVMLFAAAYLTIGITGPGGRAQTFGPCLYFSITTITTVGYGDWYPLPQARVIAAIEALIGYAFMGLFIAALTNLLGKQPRP